VREQQLALAERFDNGASRTQTAEGFKQKSDTLLHLLVGVEHHLTLCVVKKADRKRHLQFAASRLAEQAATHASLHHMQFRFAHRAL